MLTSLRVLRLLAAAVWFGGLVFFAFILAPVAFSHLATHDAGTVVGASLRILHSVGLVCALILIVTTLLLPRVRRTPKFLIVTGIMLLLTLYSQYRIFPQMDADRAIAGDIHPGLPCQNNACSDFTRLHQRSEAIELFVLIGGLSLIEMLAMRED